jgi:hypothetical protein
LLDFKYATPIDVNQTADVSVVLRQEFGAEEERPPPDGTHTYKGELDQLGWPVTLRLEGLGLDWTMNNIPLKQDTALPATEHWVPRAKAAGEYVMRFPLRDINHAAERHGFAFVSDTVKVTVNGVKKDVHDSDDLTLPLSVWMLDMPKWWYDQLTFWGSILSFILGSGIGGKLLIKWWAKNF